MLIGLSPQDFVPKVQTELVAFEFHILLKPQLFKTYSLVLSPCWSGQHGLLIFCYNLQSASTPLAT